MCDLNCDVVSCSDVGEISVSDKFLIENPRKANDDMPKTAYMNFHLNSSRSECHSLLRQIDARTERRHEHMHGNRRRTSGHNFNRGCV